MPPPRAPPRPSAAGRRGLVGARWPALPPPLLLLPAFFSAAHGERVASPASLHEASPAHAECACLSPGRASSGGGDGGRRRGSPRRPGGVATPSRRGGMWSREEPRDLSHGDSGEGDIVDLDDLAGSATTFGDFFVPRSPLSLPDRDFLGTGEIPDPPEYGQPEYWDQRYRGESEPYDWLEYYSGLRGFISTATRGARRANILHVGCGSSLLPEEMHDEGYANIINIDTSRVIIDRMRSRNERARPDLEWVVMDATHMQFNDGVFDVVIDKGVLDTFSCMWNSTTAIASYFDEVARVLRPGGAFVSVGFTDPRFFKQILPDHFDVKRLRTQEFEPNSLEHPFPTYAYVARTRSLVPTE